MKVNVAHVNAFTKKSAGGNPAGIVIDAENLTEDAMQKIAKLVGFSETAFISSSNKATRKIRFFTPEGEVDLCGHATIASWYYLHSAGAIESGTYVQETRAGLLGVEINESGLVYMEQIAPQFFETIGIKEIAKVLNIDISDFHETLLPQIVSTGLRDLLVPVANIAVLERIIPDFDAMSHLSKQLNIVSLHVYALHVNGENIASARNFAPLFGIDEESATGTSNGALLCYLTEHGIIPTKDRYTIEQGAVLGQPSRIFGKFKDTIVWVGGEASLINHIEFEI